MPRNRGCLLVLFFAQNRSRIFFSFWFCLALGVVAWSVWGVIWRVHPANQVFLTSSWTLPGVLSLPVLTRRWIHRPNHSISASESAITPAPIRNSGRLLFFGESLMNTFFRQEMWCRFQLRFGFTWYRSLEMCWLTCMGVLGEDFLARITATRAIEVFSWVWFDDLSRFIHSFNNPHRQFLFARHRPQTLKWISIQCNRVSFLGNVITHCLYVSYKSTCVVVWISVIARWPVQWLCRWFTKPVSFGLLLFEVLMKR